MTEVIVQPSPIHDALNLLILARSHQSEKVWATALDKALKIVIAARKKNPTKSPRQIFQYKYLRTAVSEPFAKAGAQTIVDINRAWNVHSQGKDLPKSDLSKLLNDARRNAKAMPTQFRRILIESKPEELEENLRKLRDDYVRRARFGVDFAARRAQNLRIVANAKPGYVKEWWGPPHPKQCSFCAALHETVIEMDAEFKVPDVGKTFIPYNGHLLVPPLHPRCRCRIRVRKANPT